METTSKHKQTQARDRVDWFREQHARACAIQLVCGAELINKMLLHLFGRIPVHVQFLVAILFNELVTTNASDMHWFVSVQTLTDETKGN